VLISGSHETASEVETAPQALDQYLAILDAYADQELEAHWYAVPPVAQERLLQAAEIQDVRDLVRCLGLATSRSEVQLSGHRLR
jgi:CHASE3 domain sensor protein